MLPTHLSVVYRRILMRRPCLDVDVNVTQHYHAYYLYVRIFEIEFVTAEARDITRHPG